MEPTVTDRLRTICRGGDTLRKHLLIAGAATALLTCKDSTGPAPVGHVVILGRMTVYAGYTSQLSALTLASNGDTLRDRVVSWATSNPSLATVTQAGLVTGVAGGQAGITATSEGKAGTAQLSIRLVPVKRVDVTPRIDSLYAGTTLQLAVTLRDSSFNVIAGPPRPVTWRSSDTSKAIVSDSGLVTARGAGSFAITATADDSVVGGAFLNAQHRVATVFMPESLTIGRYEVVRLIPDLRASSGTHLRGREVTWTNSDPTVVALSPAGVVTPLGLGTTLVAASSSGSADTTRIRVVPEPVTGLTLFDSGAGGELEAGDAVRIIYATVVDGVGRDVLGTPVTWTSSDTTIARVEPAPDTDRNGLVTGVFRGIATITASAGGKVAGVPVRVRLPAARFVFQYDSLEVHVGAGRYLEGALEDSLGHVVAPDVYSPVHYSSSDTSVAVADTTVYPVLIRGRRVGRTTMIGHTDAGFADTATIIVRAAGSDRFGWSMNRVDVANYSSSWPLTLVALDSGGFPSTKLRDVTITSSDSTIAFASPGAITGMTGTAEIAVRARGPGAARLVARANDSLFATLYVTTIDVPAVSVRVMPRPGTLRQGDTLRLRAAVTDKDGVEHDYPLAWATSDRGRATVSDSGLVTAGAAGDVVIIATSQGKRDSVAIVIQSANPPVVGAISPDTLTPGAAGSLTGSNFDPDPAANFVRVDGVMATVNGASADGLSFVLPPATAFPCSPSHNALITVTSGGRVAVRAAPLRVAVPRTLALGTAVPIPDAETGCNEIAPPPGSYGTEYWLSVANVTASADAVAAFELRGEIPPAIQATSRPAGAAPPPTASSLSWGPPDVTFDRDSLRRAAALHRQLLEQSRALARRAGPAGPLLQAARATRPAVAPGLALSVVATINDVARIRIPRLEDPDFCASYRSVDARLVYAGTHSLIFEDVGAPIAGQMDSYYQTLGREFDTTMWTQLLAHFGNPLALDALLDENGKIAMLFTPVVNGYGLGGFVVSCDFYPESVAPSSNTGEIFYAGVPTTIASGYKGNTRDNWLRFTRSVVMHEAKHITAYAERLSRDAPFEEPWLEEGSAVLAEELWARLVYGTAWKGNATYRQTLYCDVRPTSPECTGRPYAMFDPLAFFYDYATEVQQRSPLGPTDYTDATFYGSAWSLLRWSIDQYATSEATFLKALVQDPALSGAENLAARTGRPIAELLSDWSLAWFADDVVTWTPSRPQLRFPSWNLRDVFAGMSQDFPAFFPASWPGSAYLLSGGFLQPVALRGGSAAFFDCQAYSGYQLLELRAPGGGSPPPELRLQLVRIR